MIDRFERFSHAIAEINRCWHKISGDEMSRHGLKGTYSVYFTTLFRHPQGITAVRLGELCGRDKADVSRALALLEARGLIRKSAENGKVYRALFTLTPQGCALAEKINAQAKAAVEYAGGDLPEEKRLVFYEVLELITANLQTLCKEGLPNE